MSSSNEHDLQNSLWVFEALLYPPHSVNSFSLSLCSISHRHVSPSPSLYAIATSASVPACDEWSFSSPFPYRMSWPQYSKQKPLYNLSLSIPSNSAGLPGIRLRISSALDDKRTGINKFMQAVCELTAWKANLCCLKANFPFCISCSSGTIAL